MQYTLITKKGKIFTFFVKEVAENYQQIYGGTVITPEILVDNKSKICYN